MFLPILTMKSFINSQAFLPPYVYPGENFLYKENILWLTNSYGHYCPAIYVRTPNSKYTIIYSHGNAEHLLSMESWIYKLSELLNVDILAYEYSGYGLSQKSQTDYDAVSPCESFCYSNINSAYDYLVNTLHINPHNIIVHGRSLGTGPSTELASKKACGGLILQSPLLSAMKVVLPISIWGDIFTNQSKIHKVKCPVLVIHGQQDNVIGFKHGKSLYDSVSHHHKHHLWIPNAGHNDIESNYLSDYIENINKFLKYIDSLDIDTLYIPIEKHFFTSCSLSSGM